MRNIHILSAVQQGAADRRAARLPMAERLLIYAPLAAVRQNRAIDTDE
jgi:hypothetical protein